MDATAPSTTLVTPEPTSTDPEEPKETVRRAPVSFSMAHALSMVRRKQLEHKREQLEKEANLEEERKEKAREKRRRRRQNQKLVKAKAKATASKIDSIKLRSLVPRAVSMKKPAS